MVGIAKILAATEIVLFYCNSMCSFHWQLVIF